MNTVDFLQACSQKLEYFIDTKTLLGGEAIHPINEIDEIFDLSNSEEFKTIAVKINPFKRVVLHYFAYNNYPAEEYSDSEYYTQFTDVSRVAANPAARSRHVPDPARQ